MMATSHRSVLVVESDEGLARSLQILIEDEAACDVRVAHSAGEAVAELQRYGSADVVVSDASTALTLLSQRSVAANGSDGVQGTTLLKMIQRRFPATAVILMTAHQAVLASLEHEGLADGSVLRKPIDPSALLESVEAATGGTPPPARSVPQ